MLYTIDVGKNTYRKGIHQMSQEYYAYIERLLESGYTLKEALEIIEEFGI